ncbi:MAG: hypothetical protein BGO51_19365 [Rhodospirillales bacterium 69-11]|nr:hypothetical protein [Rhodospirillales bacterium]OJW28637.1 MAG: hypothetical protein BGO51_19365 [Rhodospirillales bacterium 69-11]
MRKRIGTALVALSAGAAFGVLGSAAPRAAELATYYHVGSWDAFSGRGEDGRYVCGVGNTNPDGRRFTLRFVIGGTEVLFSASKPSWNIPADTQVPVVMQIGLDAPWTMQAHGNEHALSWTMERAAIQTFDEQFRRAMSLTLSFPEGNEAPWTVPLNGSTAISNAFGRCITDLTARSGGTSPAAAPQGPTQPFGTQIPAAGSSGATGAAPASNAPSQPMKSQ